jgi:hypothetical protein
MKKVVVEELVRDDNAKCFRLSMNEGKTTDRAVAEHYKMFRNVYEKTILRDCKGYKWSDGKLYFPTFERADYARQIIEARLVAKKLMKAK